MRDTQGYALMCWNRGRRRRRRPQPASEAQLSCALLLCSAVQSLRWRRRAILPAAVSLAPARCSLMNAAGGWMGSAVPPLRSARSSPRRTTRRMPRRSRSSTHQAAAAASSPAAVKQGKQATHDGRADQQTHNCSRTIRTLSHTPPQKQVRRLTHTHSSTVLE